MRHLRLLIAAATVGALATSTVVVRTQVKAPDKAEVALRAAMEKESVAGDLKAAIEEYRKIATTYATSNRPVAARALFRLAGCYEKLGGEEARKTYQRLLSEYADQADLATEARTRLAALTAPAATPTFTKIRVPTKLPRFTDMALSPDGQQLGLPVRAPESASCQSMGRRVSTIAGAAQRIARHNGRWSSVRSVQWSSDGKWIALTAWERQPEGGEEAIIYMVPSAGGELTRIPLELKNYVQDYWDLGVSLSPDGAWLAYTTYKDGENATQRRVYLTPTKGGSPRALTPPTSREPVFSPDGKHIAYVGLLKVEGRSADRPLGRQVWVIPTDGGTAQLVYEMSTPGRLRNPVWSPDGTALTFLVGPETDDATHLLFVHVTPEGRPVGSPIEIKLPQVTQDTLPGWGADNRIGLVFKSSEVTALYTVSASGGKAVQVTASEAYMPSWARDGSRLYFGGFDPKDPPIRLASVPASGGTRHQGPDQTRPPLRHPAAGRRDFRFARREHGSCSARYYHKSTAKEPSRFFTVPIEGGELTEVPTGMPWVYRPAWSPDGESIVFIGGEDVPKTNNTLYNIYTMPLKGGTPQPLTSTTDKVLLVIRTGLVPGREVHRLLLGRRQAEDGPCGRWPVEGPGGGAERVLAGCRIGLVSGWQRTGLPLRRRRSSG